MDRMPAYLPPAFRTGRTVHLFLSGGGEVPCREDAPGCGSVVADGWSCPACRDLWAVLDLTGKIRAFSRHDMLEVAVAHVIEKWGGAAVEAPSPWSRVLCPDAPAVDYDAGELSGYAECSRCRQPVGRLVVRVPTMFGLDEDARVLAGPWKVY